MNHPERQESDLQWLEDGLETVMAYCVIIITTPFVAFFALLSCIGYLFTGKTDN